MFLSKKRYSRLKYRLGELEKAIEEHDESFFNISGDILALSERVTDLEEEAESVAEERKRDRDFFEGFSNIMNYEVPNGRCQTK